MVATPSVLASKCIAIGISTGGPPALAALFKMLKPPMPPIVVVQHMPEGMTQSLAWRLNSISSLTIIEASNRSYLSPNEVFLAAGGKHLKVHRFGGKIRTMINDGSTVSNHKPSIDLMMKSVVATFGQDCLGVIMTGMGRDGSEGCHAIREAGGYVLGQDQATSDVYGMNKFAHTEGNVDCQFALPDVATVISRHVEDVWLRDSSNSDKHELLCASHA